MTMDEQENVHKNLLSYDKVASLDVPPPLDNVLIYRATLGHKANHSFRPNTVFFDAKNPRWLRNVFSATNATFPIKIEWI